MNGADAVDVKGVGLRRCSQSSATDCVNVELPFAQHREMH